MCLEIFGNDTFLCPVRTIKKYLHEKSKYNINNDKKHFLMTKDSKGYTGRDFNATLSSLTSKLTAKSNAVVKSHSLRAGVSSELAKRGADPSQIQRVGRLTFDA